MITIIHGDDIVNSRKYLSSEKQRLKNFVVFEGDSLTIENLAQNLEGKGLFVEKQAVVIENFLSKKTKSGRDAKAIIDFIKKHASSDILLWENKEVSKKTMDAFPQVLNKLFKFPQKLFFFLDSLKPGNKGEVNLFHEVLSRVEVELIFFMLVRQFRLLLGLSDQSSKENVDEVLRLAPWQRGKLAKQGSFFTQNKLKEIYKRLCELDVSQKTGGLNMSLVQAIDILLLEI